MELHTEAITLHKLTSVHDVMILQALSSKGPGRAREAECRISFQHQRHVTNLNEPCYLLSAFKRPVLGLVNCFQQHSHTLQYKPNRYCT